MTEPFGAVPARAAGGRTALDDDGLDIPADVTGTVDILFDGNRVWSFSPSQHTRLAAGERRIPWPRLLRPHLNGTTRVDVVEHDSGTVLFSAEQSFGTGEGRLRFTDERGNPRFIDKWGFVQMPMSSRDPANLAPALDATEEILDVLSSDCGLPAWIAFGSLLGAVREGKVIPHDNDLDVAYLSLHENPVDVAREMFRVSRALQQRGMSVLTKTGSFVTVIAAIPGGGRMAIDVYACFYVGDILYESSSVGAPVPRDALLPLGTLTFEGRRLPAPRDPRVLLEASYGPGWEVPDPGFRYQIPPSLKRRFLGWYGSSMRNRRYWDRLYEGGLGYQISEDPSPFAQWVLPQLFPERPLLDVGCGNGRDTFWLAGNGLAATGLDYSKAAMRSCRAHATRRSSPAAFRLVNFYDLRDTLVTGALICRDTPPPRSLYARFLLHALEPDGRRTFWQFADMVLRGGGAAFFEFRTRKDIKRPHAFERHYCQYLRPDDVCDEISRAGGEVVDRVEDTGLSPYDGEDPYLCRLKAVWTR
ncbi:MAG: LicD family protein [Nocardioidaceae bacterium]